jgi:hypothetical protein
LKCPQGRQQNEENESGDARRTPKEPPDFGVRRASPLSFFFFLSSVAA